MPSERPQGRPVQKRTGRQKHIPQRTCIVCRETSAKRTLTRLVRVSEGEVEIDPTGRKNGRGAYLCDNPSCWERAVSTPLLERALRTRPGTESINHIKEFAAGLRPVTDEQSATVDSKESAQ